VAGCGLNSSGSVLVHIRDKTFVACNGDILYALNMTWDAVFCFCRIILVDEQAVTHSCKKNPSVNIFRCFITVMGGHGDFLRGGIFVDQLSNNDRYK
jgi:hypothetical protein